MTGCSCGWPIDSCNRDFADDSHCGRQEYEAAVHRSSIIAALESQAAALEIEAKSLREAVALLSGEEEVDA